MMEYTALRAELVSIFNRETQLFTLIVTALGVVYGIIFASGFFDLILFIPILIYPLALKYRYGTFSVKMIGDYLEKRTEEQIKIIINDPRLTNELKWKGWQHYWNDPNEPICNEVKKNKTEYDLKPKYILFVFIPLILAALYSLLIVIIAIFNSVPFFINEGWSGLNATNQTASKSNLIISKTMFSPITHGIFLIVLLLLIVHFYCEYREDKKRQ